MPKHRNEPFKTKIFNLSEETINNLKEMSKFEDMNQSEFVEHLIKNWEMGINPSGKLIHLNKEREKLKEKINLIDEEINKTTEHLKLFESWKKDKSKKKQEAIEVIKRQILIEDFEEAERISKVWQRMTGISSIELLYESKKQLNKEGI